MGGGGGVGRDQLGNMKSLQRDGLARIRAVDASWIPVRKNKNICFCTVSRPTTYSNFTNPLKLCIVPLSWPDETRGEGVIPKAISIGILPVFALKG